MTAYSKDFKRDALKYSEEHPDMKIKDVTDRLGIPVGTLYDWVNPELGNRNIQKQNAMKSIRQIYDGSYCIYRAPKITEELHKRGFNTSERTVTRYMKEMGI